jgi:spermidine/putrescine transport system ATP-binding protein
LEPLRARKPNQLSGGQQQRVAIARAVVNQPLVLLLDEPLSALDSSLRKDMQIELKSLQRRLGITFIMVTHDQQEALSISDRVVVMADGCIEQVGTPRQVYERPNNLYVAKFIGAANIFNALVTECNDNQVKVLLEHKEYNLKTDRHFTVGQHVAVVIRPEDLKTWDRSEVEDVSNMIPLIVEQVIYKGTTVDLILRTESGMQLSATEFFDEDDEELDFKIGERVWGEWHLGWEIVLPND